MKVKRTLSFRVAAPWLAAVMALVMSLAFAMPVAAQVNTFRDVPATHFAFQAISWVSDPSNGALMVGDIANNFHPGRPVDKFEAAIAFAMAAGYRHASHLVTPSERAMFDRSFDMWRPFLDSMAAQFARWSRTADREIAYLLYRGILTVTDVEHFITRTGNVEQVNPLTRQEAIAWMVRLMGRQAHAQAVVLPFAVPFQDDALIHPAFARYVYYAKQAGIVGGAGGGNFNPTHAFTRAEMAVLFYTIMSDLPAPEPPQAPQLVGQASTVIGVIEMVYRDTALYISSPLGPQRFNIAPGAVIMVDNVQRTPAFLHTGMQVTALVDGQRAIVSLVTRTGPAIPGNPSTGQPQPTPVPTPTPGLTSGVRLYAGEGVVLGITLSPPTIAIQTRRVSLFGHVTEEERTLSLAPGAVITRGTQAVTLATVQVGDIASFWYNGNIIHEFNMMERERAINGVLVERRPADTLGGQSFILETAAGVRYELRATPQTAITRGHNRGLNLQHLRIGDNITAHMELGNLVALHAEGLPSVANGVLREIRITQHFSQVTLAEANGDYRVFTLLPDIFDIHALRIGMELRLLLDSHEVMDMQIMSQNLVGPVTIMGRIQSLRQAPGGTPGMIMTIDGHNQTHNILVNAQTLMRNSDQPFNIHSLWVNMDVLVELTGPHSTVARSIMVLP